jgi:broad specificity phosphatase PhoE
MAFTRRAVVALGCVTAVAAFSAPVAAMAEEIDLPAMLRAGGLVILLRHGATSPNPVDSERGLNSEGRAMARSFGEILREIRAPIGKVYTSQLSRAYDTAALAGFAVIEKTPDLTESSTSMGKPGDIESGRVVSSDEKSRRANALRKMLGTEPDEGTNTVLVTHKPNIIDALGNDLADIGEGEAAIFRPGANGSYRLIARVPANEWPRLAAEK